MSRLLLTFGDYPWAACADVGEEYAGTISGGMNMTGQLAGVIGMSLAKSCYAAARPGSFGNLRVQLWVGGGVVARYRCLATAGTP